MSDPRKDLVAVFKELAELTKLEEQNPNSFRVRAYENVQPAIRGLTGDVRELTEAQLAELDGIGKSSAKKIREWLSTGKLDKLEELRKKHPPDVVAMSRLPGLGPKKIAKLRAELSIESIEDLESALADGKIATLSGFGEKTAQNIARSLERLGMTGKERRVALADALPVAHRFVSALEALPDVERAQYCGSLRRLRETIGDVDILVAARTSAPIMDAFVKLPDVHEVLAQGQTKSSILTREGLQVDLRVVEPEQLGAATMYFTGSKAHNIKLRQLAIDEGYLLNEYGLIDKKTEAIVASETEEEIYAKLGLQMIPPPMREDAGEVERAAKDDLPAFPTLEDLHGDCHVHTTLSGDGKSTLRDVLTSAAARGYQYIAITDHAEGLPLVGATRDAIAKQKDEIAALRDDFPGLAILHGVELNIGPDGELDWDEDFRMSFDFCVAAVHGQLDLPEARQTARILKAMDDPSVNVIGHLSSRMIGRRPGMELDYGAILQKAAESGCALEINSALRRLDLASDVLLQARDLDITFIVSSDAHHVDELDQVRWGALQSQRGWVDKARVANTWTRDRFVSWVASNRG